MLDIPPQKRLSLPPAFRSRPWLVAPFLAWINRWSAGSPARRGAFATALLLTAVVLIGSIAGLLQRPVDRSGTEISPWLLVAAFAVAAAWAAFKRVRVRTPVPTLDWMASWPINLRSRRRWRNGGHALQVVGLLGCLSAVATPLLTHARGWAALGIVAVITTAMVLSSATSASAAARATPPKQASPLRALTPKALAARPFFGLQQARNWQRHAVGGLSLRPWAMVAGIILTSLPTSLNQRVSLLWAAQLLIPLLLWPLVARAMASSLHTLSAASRLLAVTPLRWSALARRLLPFPIALSTGFAVLIAADLRWMQPSLAAALILPLALLLWDAVQLARTCWRCRGHRASSQRPTHTTAPGDSS